MLPVTPDQLAKAMFPGLKAVTMKCLENAVLDRTQQLMSEWLRNQFKECNITATTDPDGKLVFLVKVNLEDFAAGH